MCASFIFVSSEGALVLQEVAYIHPFENNNVWFVGDQYFLLRMNFCKALRLL